MKLRSTEAKVIIIGGKARSGKDTIMSIIKKRYELDNKKVINLQISSYIKEYAKKISNWSGSDEDKPRALLQELGTDIIRKNIDDLFFVKRIIEDIKVYSYFFDVIIISDARFPVEIESVKNNFKNTISIGVKRPNVSVLTSKEETHATEVSLDNYNDFDFVIENDKGLEELEMKVYEMYKIMEGKK